LSNALRIPHKRPETACYGFKRSTTGRIPV
jgi:hypothetical protein